MYTSEVFTREVFNFYDGTVTRSFSQMALEMFEKFHKRNEVDGAYDMMKFLMGTGQ